MATDYVLFIHGVNVRDPEYAQPLINNIKAQIADAHGGEKIDFKPIVFYWGGLAQLEVDKLIEGYSQSPSWPQFWYRGFREKNLLQFIGDTVLYVSRFVGAQLVNALQAFLASELADVQAGDRLHIISHSLGTVILFDLIFSSRWDDEQVPGHDSVEWIRNKIYGINPDGSQEETLRIASVSTMASPLSLFKLMDVDDGTTNKIYATHDVTPRMQSFLQGMAQGGSRLPWLNFAHPGDPIAYPLNPLLLGLVDQKGEYLALKDYVQELLDPLEKVVNPIQAVGVSDPIDYAQIGLALPDLIAAHLVYWTSQTVAEAITQTLLASAL